MLTSLNCPLRLKIIIIVHPLNMAYLLLFLITQGLLAFNNEVDERNCSESHCLVNGALVFNESFRSEYTNPKYIVNPQFNDIKKLNNLLLNPINEAEVNTFKKNFMRILDLNEDNLLPEIHECSVAFIKAGEVANIEVKGANFVLTPDAHTCKWEWGSSSVETNAQVISDTLLTCPTPADEITENTVRLYIGYMNTYYSQEAITLSVVISLQILKIKPDAIIRTGGLIKVYLNKQPPPRLLCKINDVLNEATLMNKAVGCVSPVIETAGSYSLELIQDLNIIGVSVPLEVIEETVLKSVEPVVVDVSTELVLTITGINFYSSSTYKCVFKVSSEEYTISATIADETTLNCLTPILPYSNIFSTLTISSSKGEVIGSFTLYHHGDAILTLMTPKCGPITGGTPVTIRGNHITDYLMTHNNLNIYCKFGELTSLASIVQTNNTILCISPPYSTP